MFDMDLIAFDVEKNKKNITRLQKLKWRLNSRWPPKIVLNFFQNAILLDFFSVLQSFF
jgi:hypothetical protein